MSWSITAVGSIDGVKKQVEGASFGTNRIGRAVQELVSNVLSQIPEEKKAATFVVVEGSGHDELAPSGSGYVYGTADIRIRIGKMAP